MSDEIPELPKGCGYRGRDFGASYIDSECFGGRLYDLDDCPEPGILYEPCEYIACPQCNHEEWLAPHLERVEEDGAIAAIDKAGRVHPFVRDRLLYPEDFDRLVAAWFKGYDSETSPAPEQPGSP